MQEHECSPSAAVTSSPALQTLTQENVSRLTHGLQYAVDCLITASVRRSITTRHIFSTWSNSALKAVLSGFPKKIWFSTGAQSNTVGLGSAARRPTRSNRPTCDAELAEDLFDLVSSIGDNEDLRQLLRGDGVTLDVCADSYTGKFGSHDLGICLSISGRGIHTRRAILLQSKCLSHDRKRERWSYSDLIGEGGNTQAKQMLEITPCSYFVLNTSSYEYWSTDFPELIRDVARRFWKARGEPVGLHSDANRDWFDADNLLSSMANYVVIPAAIIPGLDASWEDPRKLLGLSFQLADLLADEFILGKVGDSSPRAIASALTPRLRSLHGIIAPSDTPEPNHSVCLSMTIH